MESEHICITVVGNATSNLSQELEGIRQSNAPNTSFQPSHHIRTVILDSIRVMYP